MKYQSIIVLGYKRSGTSLLRVMLNSHPDIAIGPEIKFMEKVIKKFPETFDEFVHVTKREAEDFEFTEETLREIYKSAKTAPELMKNWCMKYRDLTNKKIWGDKTPQNYKYLKLLSENFPDSLFIHIVRHPFDSFSSSKKRGHYHGIRTNFAWFLSNYNLRYVRRKNYMHFRYEDFIKNPQLYIDQILEKLEVEKIDLASTYQNFNHGRIAEGDSWNRSIKDYNTNKKKENVLTATEKFLIKLVCFPYLKKYDYK